LEPITSDGHLMLDSLSGGVFGTKFDPTEHCMQDRGLRQTNLPAAKLCFFGFSFFLFLISKHALQHCSVGI